MVGGGPAGATVALSLARRGWSVCLFESTVFDGERYGETLPPEINPLLRELGVFDQFRALDPLESRGSYPRGADCATSRTTCVIRTVRDGTWIGTALTPCCSGKPRRPA